jgi:hypothetical protein
MALARKKKLNDQCQKKENIIGSSPKARDTPKHDVSTMSYMSRNWATAGFFDATVSFESIRAEDDMPQGTGERPIKQIKLNARRLTRQLESGEFVYEDIEIGDVFEEVRTNRAKHGPLHLYKVLEIYPNSKAVLVQSSFGKEKKKVAELLDEKCFKLILTDAIKKGEKKNNFLPMKSIRDPLLEDKAKYSGEQGKAGLFNLFRHAPEEYQPSLVLHHREATAHTQSVPDLPSSLRQGEGRAALAPTITTHRSQLAKSASNLHMHHPESLPTQQAPVVTPRLAYIRACHREALPPIPLLAKCFDESYPVLDLTDQSVGSRYCVALAGSLPNMKFLKEVNLSGNRLDNRSACIIIHSLRSSSIESLILDNNKIGKQGVSALISLLTEATSGPTVSVGDATPAAASGSRLPPLPIAGMNAVASPNKKNRRPSTVIMSSFVLVKLSLNDNEIGDTQISKLIKCLCVCGIYLKQLGLRNNKCSMFTAKALSEMLTQSSLKLEYLDVSWNNLQSKGGSIVIKALLRNDTVQEAKFDWNGIGDEIIPLLQNLAVSNTSALLFMTLQHNHVSDRILKEIEVKCPVKRLRFNQGSLENVMGSM